jgi:hypothetical protein
MKNYEIWQKLNRELEEAEKWASLLGKEAVK